jgi:hypothetical protein
MSPDVRPGAVMELNIPSRGEIQRIGENLKRKIRDRRQRTGSLLKVTAEQLEESAKRGRAGTHASHSVRDD